MVIGAWRRRRDALFGPFLAYAVLLFAFSAIVSAVHVPGGTFIHSAVALAPHGYVLALEGIVAGGRPGSPRGAGLGRDVGRARVRRRGRRRSACSPRSSARARSHRSWDAKRQDMQAVGDGARRRGRARDRPGHVDRRLRVPLLDRPPGRGRWSTTRSTRSSEVARAYGIRVAGPRAQGQRRGRARRSWSTTSGRLGRPADPRAATSVSLYPVCLDAGDPRCPTALASTGR